MSSKWRALQQRHRYTYSSVVFPKPYLEALNGRGALASSSVAFDLFAQLRHFTSLTSTYAQVAAAKDLAAAFAKSLSKPAEVAAPDGDDVAAGARFFLEILFLENSLPLHRTLISAIAKCRSSISLIGSYLESLCEEYSGKKEKNRFLVSRAALSLISYPKLGFLSETLEKCSDLVAVDIVSSLGSVVKEIDEGSRPSPVVMEQCQEAMSCLYYLLQRFPATFISSNGVSDTFQRAIFTIMSVLKSPSFSRDCLVAAGVGFCAAVQVCMSPEEISSFISRSLFDFCIQDGVTGLLERDQASYSCNFCADIRELSVLSRLCLLRGILTAISRNVLNMHLIELTSGSLWTVLYNGILPELCNYCENPIDSHFNFHALTVTQICLQQVRTSLTTGLTAFSGDYNPFPEKMVNRVLKIIWNNLEDPLNQTVKQVHLIFDLLLDIESSLPCTENHGSKKSFLYKVAGDVLSLGPRCKGRYVPLAVISKRLGAKTLLNLNNNLLFETAYAYRDDDVCCATTSFLKCFLECLRDECWSSDGVEKGFKVFREICLPPLLHGLVSGHSKLRSNLNTYALPLMLEIDSDSIFPMLEFISVGPKIKENTNLDFEIDQCVAALVSLLKVSRALALIEGDIDFEQDTLAEDKLSGNVALVCMKGIDIRLPVEWIILALNHADDSLRIDAAEFLFLNPKTSSLPSSLELNLMKVAVPLNMRCSSTAFQMKWTSLFRKFFARVRTALERQFKQGSWKPISCTNAIENGSSNYYGNLVVFRAQALFEFMNWISFYLFSSCYPSAPYERKTMAMELILVMLDVWPVTLPEGVAYLYPYKKEIISPDATLALVGSIIDSWDRLRQSSFRILLCFPTPLPGVSSNNSLNELIAWAKKLVCSPRVRESDAGSLTLRLVFKKYVLGLGWVFQAHDGNPLGSQPELIKGDLGLVKSINPVVVYILSLVKWLETLVEEGEKDLTEACRRSFVHGVLLALRYTFEELDWSSDVVQSSISEIRNLLEKLLDLIMRITSLALSVVSSDAWSIPYDIEDMIEDSAAMEDISFDQVESISESADQILPSKDNSSPADQVVMVGCWLAMKEVSLLLGTIIRKIPLPSCVPSGSSKHVDSEISSHESEMASEGMLDLVQLEMIGNYFLQVLLKMKHNGAIDKTRAGFTALCNRLLCSNNPRLCRMTETWLEKLMERTISKRQTVDDLLRRSAGIPAAFIALFLSEPEGTPKKLLPRALRWLIDVAKETLFKNSENGNIHEPDIQDEPSPDNLPGNQRVSKIRDEGVVPTVHAFNVLRVAFDDTNLATDTSGFAAETMIVSIRSFSSPYWEVRNSACLAYTTLVRRMIGFLNVHRRESARRALTGLDFFHRYPALHSFLFSELNIATEFLDGDCSKETGSNIAKAIHPSLCPILILLTRLKPSLVSSIADDPLDPFLFLPFLRKCATQSNLRLRVLASRALTGLVSNQKLPAVIIEVASCLPNGKHQMSMPNTSFLPPVSAYMSNGVSDKHNYAASFNSIHGLLLHLCSLLDNNCKGLSDTSKKDQILGELVQNLSRCSWIGRMRSCPCPTLNCSYLRVLDLMFDIARTYSSKFTSAIQDLLLHLASESLDVVASSELALHDPTLIELRKQAVVSYFACLLEERNEDSRGMLLHKFSSSSRPPKLPVAEISVSDIQESIKSLLSDPTYEVRLATLKKLLQLVQSKKPREDNCVIYTWAEVYLHKLLVNLLPLEENPKCIYYVLRIFYYWNLIQLDKSFHADTNFVFLFWDKLVDLNGRTVRVKTQEISLCCMGICVREFAMFLMRSFITNEHLKENNIALDSIRTDHVMITRAFKNIDAFVGLVKQHSTSSEPVTMRKAAAEAIIASGLLADTITVASSGSPMNCSFSGQVFNIEEVISKFDISKVINIYACKILELWFTCIQLLEDEDITLREKLAKDVQISINYGRPGKSSFADDVHSQVDRIILSSFDFLSSVFGNWSEYLNYLAEWVFVTASPVSSDGDLVRQIFDKEIDNHHEEKLLICQICCLHLEKLCVSKAIDVGMDPLVLGENNIQIFPWNWRFKFLRQLYSLANTYLKIEGKTDWIGGIGNHKDAFISVYANMLGLYALSHSLGEGISSPGELTDTHKLYLSEFLELGGVIMPLLKNPLISKLYSLLMLLHHKMLSALRAQQFVEDYQSCSFDPYFLLR